MIKKVPNTFQTFQSYMEQDNHCSVTSIYSSSKELMNDSDDPEQMEVSLTFHLIRNIVLYLDVHEKASRTEGVTVLVSHSDVPEPTSNQVHRKHSLTHKHMVLIYHSQPHGGQIRQKDLQ